MRAVVTDELPAAFPVAGRDAPLALNTVEAAITGGHQKEALVLPAAGGPVWRLASDEGAYLRGTDLAPAPLMYWAAGVHADFAHRFARLARDANAGLRRLSLDGGAPRHGRPHLLSPRDADGFAGAADQPHEGLRRAR